MQEIPVSNISKFARMSPMSQNCKTPALLNTPFNATALKQSRICAQTEKNLICIIISLSSDF